MMKIAFLVGSALSANAYVLPGPAVAPVMRSGAISMQELVVADVKKAPSSGFTLSMAGGVRTVADVYAAQEKARKKEDIYATRDAEVDVKRTQGGWTTKPGL